MTDYIAMATQAVQGLRPYQPGKPVAELERELGIGNSIKLASNENPLGPSPKVTAAIAEHCAELTRYPDSSGYLLKQALSERFDIEPAQITLGNGSNNVLDLIARAYLQPGLEAIYSQHGFLVYALATQASGAKAVVTPAKDRGHDLDAMAAAVTDKTRVIFLANPNNPTGTWFDKASLRRFMAQVPESVIVVLDEAYAEYVSEAEYPLGSVLLKDYPNLIVTRTFSKAYGLAAVRIGYSLSNPHIADILNRIRTPFNVNSLAMAAALAALADEDYLQRSVALNYQGMQQLEMAMQSLGLGYIPSVGNFLAIDFKTDAMPIYQALLQAGVIVRPIANYELPHFLRVTIGTEQENQRFIDALQLPQIKALY